MVESICFPWAGVLYKLERVGRVTLWPGTPCIRAGDPPCSGRWHRLHHNPRLVFILLPDSLVILLLAWSTVVRRKVMSEIYSLIMNHYMDFFFF